ncbi:hypothetical protein Sked_30260 [Sanguibacter keddieii DSM 10542]|uniref:Uncharacterized protein n=1 Tax=Sanguibacter keddieii (strain ATCC 51767 / DSM 10542 / NCFB 3025 / ST-74) TaxID=446469 RepID=D1BCD9_SANKS|nr:hypothetical protein [Sanguibacter keddieii]ACZ22926.1 hypothetical protein Sked_30260 [Sanguibacter keddieii DSM 10542]
MDEHADGTGSHRVPVGPWGDGAPFADAELPPRRWPAVATAGSVVLALATVVVAATQLSRLTDGDLGPLQAWATYGLVPGAVLLVLVPTVVAAGYDRRRVRRELAVRAAVAAAPPPQRTEVRRDPHVDHDSAVAHAARTAVHAPMDPVLLRQVALGVARHLRRHSADHYPERPVGYQFVLENGSSAVVTDLAVGRRRALEFSSDRVVPGFHQPTGAIVRPAHVPDHEAWFTWPMTPREQRRTLRALETAVSTVYVNRSTTVPEGVILLDPLAPPAPVDRAVVEEAWRVAAARATDRRG